MKVICVLSFFLCFLSSVSPSFGETATSVEKILKAKPDSNKVKQLSDLCWNYRFISSDSALLFGEQALKLAREINFRKGIAQAYNDMAIIYMDKSSFRSADNYLSEAMKIRQQLNDQPGIASLHNKLGIIDQKQGRLKDALQHQIEALKIYRKLGEDKWIGYSLNNIAIIHQNLGNLDNALKYHQEALRYRIKLKDSE
ncbi:MAG TPA: tetratricopeptide repeat protein, partial [Bacteroidales bacterium]|nr:tetratricopeptide repeat protein [Bacteroidales bacterium]